MDLIKNIKRKSIARNTIMFLAAITVGAAVATDALAAGHVGGAGGHGGGGGFGGGHISGGFGGGHIGSGFAGGRMAAGRGRTAVGHQGWGVGAHFVLISRLTAERTPGYSSTRTPRPKAQTS